MDFTEEEKSTLIEYIENIEKSSIQILKLRWLIVAILLLSLSHLAYSFCQIEKLKNMNTGEAILGSTKINYITGDYIDLRIDLLRNELRTYSNSFFSIIFSGLLLGAMAYPSIKNKTNQKLAIFLKSLVARSDISKK